MKGNVMPCRWKGMSAAVVLLIVVPVNAESGPLALAQGINTLARELADAIPGGDPLRVAVASLRDMDGTVTPSGRYIAMKLPRLLLGTGRFRVLVRGDLDRLIDTLRNEQKDIYDPSTVGRIGRLVGAEAIIMGEVFDLGNALRVFVWVTDVERRVRLASADVLLKKDERLSQIGVSPDSGESGEKHRGEAR